MTCAVCGADLGRLARVGRRDVCPRCAADLHSCRQCAFHDPQAPHGCREPDAERVLDPTRSNFCDFWAARVATPTAEAAPASTRADLDRLFRRS